MKVYLVGFLLTFPSLSANSQEDGKNGEDEASASIEMKENDQLNDGLPRNKKRQELEDKLGDIILMEEEKRIEIGDPCNLNPELPVCGDRGLK